MAPNTDDYTEDTILAGRVRVRQPRAGYRVNVDTILLSAAVEAEPGMRLMEAGCGVAAASLALAKRTPNVSLLGVERNAEAAAFARVNVALNALSERVEIAEADALDRRAQWGVFDGVFFNPPFDAAGEGRAPAEPRRHAHLAQEPIAVWIGALADRLRGGAALTLVHRAARLPEILAALEGRLGGVEVLPIRPNPDEIAGRVLVRARKGSRAPLRLLAGLDLHPREPGAKHTAETEAILRGQSLIAWR